MAEAITVARPYAQAAFMFANSHHTLKDWSEMLGLLAGIADDADMHEVGRESTRECRSTGRPVYQGGR